MRTLVWFRTDLRVLDNTALHHASAAGGGCAGLFIVSPGEWRAHDVAPVRVQFLLRNARELREQLARLNIPLWVETVEQPVEIPSRVAEVAARLKANQVLFNREYELNEWRRDEATIELCARVGIRAAGYDDQLILPPGSVRTQEGRAYTVFTPFRKRWLARLEELGAGKLLAPPGVQRPLEVLSGEVPLTLPGFQSRIPAELWPAGEGVAQKRLAEFTSGRIGSYKGDRDFPGVEGTSALSPYLAAGVISARHCLAAARAANGGRTDGEGGAATWITELVWREFYVHLIRVFPKLCMHRAFKPETERIRWSDNEAHFEAWKEGRTGVPIVDAAQRQLVQTGWMHNRLRMISAMYLTKDLFIDWRKGEKFFMQHLVDGFLASNNGGWQWSASTGTDAAPYFRIFNPVTQSEKFDPEGTFIRKWCPELAGLSNEEIHNPAGLPGLARAKLEYPEPIVDRSKTKERVMEAFGALK